MMKEAIKLTGVTGELIYVRDTFSIIAVCERKEGDLSYTEIIFHGCAFRVRNPIGEVAALLGWEKAALPEPSSALH